jgi:hypothetical protein
MELWNIETPGLADGCVEGAECRQPGLSDGDQRHLEVLRQPPREAVHQVPFANVTSPPPPSTRGVVHTPVAGHIRRPDTNGAGSWKRAPRTYKPPARNPSGRNASGHDAGRVARHGPHVHQHARAGGWGRRSSRPRRCPRGHDAGLQNN